MTYIFHQFVCEKHFEELIKLKCVRKGGTTNKPLLECDVCGCIRYASRGIWIHIDSSEVKE